MQKRRLGQTDIEVSIIGLGTVKFGRNQGVKYPYPFALPSDAVLATLLSLAHDLGINLLDTAPAYGRSEERLGQLLQGKRHDFVISTKVGETFIEGESHFDFSKKTIQQSIERSLKNLRTDYLDVVLVHSNGDDERLIHELTVFESLESLKQEGKIRAYGMSTKTLTGGLLTIKYADVAMVAFHQGYTDERPVLQYAQAEQKGVFIKKALASGHLSLQSPTKEALQFVLAEQGVTSVIVGTINPQHLRENVQDF